MIECAELELSLTPLDGERCSLRFRFWQPGNAAEVVLGAREPLQITVNPADLAQVDPSDYGKRIGEAVFAQEAARLALAQARAAASGAGVPLRVRIFLDASLHEYHQLRWETLLLPGEQTPLSLQDGVLLSRFLPSENLHVFRPPQRRRLRALVVVSNPANLPAAFQPLDVPAELARARAGLAEMDLVELAGSGKPTLEAIAAALQNDVDILYLVAHGGFLKNLGTVVLLEKDDGRGDLTPVQQFAEALRSLPVLAVLVSCQSASGTQPTQPMMALGPALVQRGIPAVLAMQGNVTFPTMQQFLPAFFTALQRDGVIDRALWAGRVAVRARPDWWMPVLFSRLRDNQLLQPPPLARDLARMEFEPETVYVPPGPFWMGQEPAAGIPDHETPRCEVELPAYRIGKYPVTNRQYATFVEQQIRGKGQSSLPLVTSAMGWRGLKPPPEQLNYPVTGVTWYQAQAYCDWLSAETGRTYRLPNEAEWEKAARGTDGQCYPWGDIWQEGLCCLQAGSCPVDAFPAQGPYGCFDLLGNAPEWTLSLWGLGLSAPDLPYRYPWQPDGRNDPTAHALLRRVVRGGIDTIERMCVTMRRSETPNQFGSPGKRIGFRVVLSEISS